jgi:tetratricopeptide (TPR) repeat protein
LPHAQHALGLAYYRAGRFEAAIEQLQKSVKGNWKNPAANWLVLAMAHHRLGHANEARTWFEKAKHRIDFPDREVPGEPRTVPQSIALYDVQACMVLRREAEVLLGIRDRQAPEGRQTPGGK